MAQYLYFKNDGSGQTILGPESHGINYEQAWAAGHPRMDNGELLYGLFTLMNGHYNSSTGNFTPGYGFPLAPSPFESNMSLIYRVWQWTRSAPKVLYILPFITALLSLLFIANLPVAYFFSHLTGHLIVYCLLLTPLIFIWAIYSVISNHAIAKRRAMNQIEDQFYSDPEVKRVVEAHQCPLCTASLHYDTSKNEATCGNHHGPWHVAF